MNFKTIFSIFAVLLLTNCTQKGAMEDVTTGLYEQGGISYLDKDGEVPAKIYFDLNKVKIIVYVHYIYCNNGDHAGSEASKGVIISLSLKPVRSMR